MPSPIPLNEHRSQTIPETFLVNDFLATEILLLPSQIERNQIECSNVPLPTELHHVDLQIAEQGIDMQHFKCQRQWIFICFIQPVKKWGAIQTDVAS